MKVLIEKTHLKREPSKGREPQEHIKQREEDTGNSPYVVIKDGLPTLTHKGVQGGWSIVERISDAPKPKPKRAPSPSSI